MMSPQHPEPSKPRRRLRLLLVDLNNHARYPTLAVGQLAAVLRAAGHEVVILSPLAVGVQGAPRDQRARIWSRWDEELRWWTAKTTTPGVQRLRRFLGRRGGTSSQRSVQLASDQFRGALQAKPDVVLLSAYDLYADIGAAMLGLCAEAEVPALVGGPGFTDGRMVHRWLTMEGASAVLAGEAESVVVELVERAAAGHDLSGVPGVSVPGAEPASPAPPLVDLDRLPFPDYDDFPWELYPARVISVLTGRGCGWGACTFCSDVLTSNGRSFRSRSLEHVLGELEHQHARHGVRLFHFSDLKLNSNVELWRGLGHGLRERVPDALWTCSVHVGGQGDQGLEQADLVRAREAGLVRVTTGVESGSQELLNRMAKGVQLERLAGFLRDAHQAGISVRVTLFTGYPGEGPEELDQSRAFLEQHADLVDRVHLSRFAIQAGTPITEQILEEPERFPDLRLLETGELSDVMPHVDARIDRRPYRRAVGRLLAVVHRINRKPLREMARPLEGVM